MPSNEFKLTLPGESETKKDFILNENFKIGYYLSPNFSGWQNEDSLFVTSNKNGLLFGVADGAGGYPQGEVASQIIVEQMAKSKPGKILNSIDKGNDHIRKKTSNAKTTLALASVKDDSIRFYCVGDSEVLLWNSNGTLVYKSIPHSLVGHKVEAGLISQDESLEDPDRNIVTHLMGEKSFSIQSSSLFNLKKGYTCLVGTDGLFDNLSHKEITDIVLGKSLSRSFDALSDFCESRYEGNQWKKDDDLAFILVGW